MPDFNVRADSVNVEQIMEQIRARIREKRGVDYTEQQIRELAAVKLERFLDPSGVRSDLLEQFRKVQPPYSPPELPNYAFEEATLYESHRGPLRFVRRLLNPILKLFFNPNPLIQALHIQSQLNTTNAQRETERRGLDQLHFEVLHNLVIETTRMSIEIKNLKMRVESLTGRLEFNERRARALESVVAYRPSTGDRVEPVQRPAVPQAEAGAMQASPQGAATPPNAGAPEGPGQRSRRRRRRRGRRGGGSAVGLMGSGAPAQAGGAVETASPSAGGESDSGPHAEFDAPDAREPDAPSEPSDEQ